MALPTCARPISEVVARLARIAALIAATGGSTIASAQGTPGDTVRAPSSSQPRDSASRQDGVRRDSLGVRLAPVQVRASIVPSAGPTIGSGVPARISMVSGLRLRAWKPRLLADALASQPGVSIYDDLGSPWKLNLSTRGFTAGPTVGLPAGVTVFLDGVRQNEADAQEVNFDLLPLEQVERVELLAGNASLLGPNSLGGAINLVTSRGEGPAAGETELSVGSFGQASIQARIGGSSSGGSDYLVAGGYERERGWRDATAARNYNALVNVGHTTAERGVTLQAYAARSRAETAGSLPESLFGTAPRANFTAGDFEDVEAQQLAVSAFAPVVTGQGGVTAYVRRSRSERFNVNQAPDPNVRSRTSNLTIGASADWRRTIAARIGEVAMRFGLDGSANDVRARIYAESVADSVGGAAAGPIELTTDVRSPSLDLAGYALVDYSVARVTLSGGGRFDFVRVPFRNQVRADNTTNDFRSFSPRVGASVALGSRASIYASAGRSFRAPAILELGCADELASCPLPFALGDDPPLRPVHATTYEVGAQWAPAWARGALAATLSAYRTNVRDEIFFVASEQAIFSGYFTNLDRTRREGVEVGFQGQLSPHFSWYGNYAWTVATFRSEAALFSVRGDDAFAGSALAGDNVVEPGSRMPLVPSGQAKIGGLLRLPGGASIGVDTRHTGRQWLRGDEANVTTPLAAYTITSARLAYAHGDWEVVTIVTNLFDGRRATFGTFNENRRTGALERFLTPMNGRAVKLTLRRSFGRPR